MNKIFLQKLSFFLVIPIYLSGAGFFAQAQTPSVEEKQITADNQEFDLVKITANLNAQEPDNERFEPNASGETLDTIKGDFSKTGRELMDEVYTRHRQYPYVYEEQSMVMVDRNNLRDTRKLRRYTRMEEDDSINFLLVFESPLEVKGVALLAYRDPAGVITKSIYLPAFGEQLIGGEEESGGSSSFLGSDFSVENLTGEVLDNYFYVRRQDIKTDEVNYFVVDVYGSEDEARDNKILRRHFIRRDNYFITETHHFDQHGRLYKKQTNHDLAQLDDEMWRSNMMLMENMKDQHRTLIKIDRRIYSRDYVPPEMFTAEWLYENYPHRVPEEEGSDEEGDEIIESKAEKAESVI